MIKFFARVRRVKRLDRRGETLVEALSAILVVALSAIMLASAILAAGRVRTQADSLSDAIYAALTRAANLTGAEGASGETAGVVDVTGAGDTGWHENVNYSYAAGDANDDLNAYVPRTTP